MGRSRSHGHGKKDWTAFFLGRSRPTTAGYEFNVTYPVGRVQIQNALDELRERVEQLEAEVQVLRRELPGPSGG
jgi:hypothetical protein